MIFEFGETEASRAFFARNPQFFPQFERLMNLGNKCLGREIRPKGRPEDIGFGLAHTCREDFLEVVFLAVNGYGNGASKILRGLYERAVALAYIVKHRDKAERLVRFAAIQEHRGMIAALKVVSEADFDKAIGAPNTVAEMRQRYQTIKPEFPRAVSWDEDVASMVNDVGAPYDTLYLGSYAIPNFSIHTSLASAMRYDHDERVRQEREIQAGEFALVNAIFIFILVIQSQNTLFGLNLDEEITICQRDLEEAWERLYTRVCRGFADFRSLLGSIPRSTPVRVVGAARYHYSDVVAVYDIPSFEDQQQETLINPTGDQLGCSRRLRKPTIAEGK